MSNVFVENETLQNIADAIRNKTGKTEKMLPAEMSAEIGSIETGGGYDQGFEDGKNSVIPLERYATTIRFASMDIFGETDVVLNLDSAIALNNLFYQAQNNTVEHLTINCPNLVTSMQQFHQWSDKTLRKLTLNVDTQKVTSYLNALGGCSALEIIDGTPLNFSSVGSSGLGSIVTNCLSLQEFRVVKNSIYRAFSVAHCSLLSDETIQSIIDGLADLTGQTALTIDWHSDIVLKLSDEQWTQLISKNWEAI